MVRKKQYYSSMASSHTAPMAAPPNRAASHGDVLAFLKIISKVDFKIEYKNARPVDVSNMVLDVEKMKRTVDVILTPMLDGISSFYNESIKK